MPFTEAKEYICKFCGRHIEIPAWSNTARLINHLYDFHSDEIEKLKDIYINEVINRAYDLKGETK